MALYNANFSYLGQNSIDNGFVVAAFEPDEGFKDTFLSMEPVYEDSRHGEFRFDYGARYNSVSVVEITIIKKDLSDFSINDTRNALKWLTGSRTNSWLDIYSGKSFQYSFLGRVTDVKQRKLDGRIIGLMIIFTSISPWAFSRQFEFNRTIEQSLDVINDGNDNLILIKDPNEMSINSHGVLCNGPEVDDSGTFDVDESGAMSVKNAITASIDNQSDDLYTYINLGVRFENQSCQWFEIVNNTIGETTRVDHIGSGEIVEIVDKQFIVSYELDQVSGQLKNLNRIFGDDFNFVWPRLLPGINDFEINGDGNGRLKFSYRYPVKIGDCAIGEPADATAYIYNSILVVESDDVVAFVDGDVFVADGGMMSFLENNVLFVQQYSN